MLKKILGNKKLIADVILVTSLLVIALSVFLIISLTERDGAFAVVTVDGEQVAKYSLDRDGEYSINGGSNILVIRDGEAYISYADCPDKTCVHGNGVFGGKISSAGQRIICLPNRVMVEIVGTEEEILG
jgi:hypothetical protein